MKKVLLSIISLILLLCFFTVSATDYKSDTDCEKDSTLYNLLPESLAVQLENKPLVLYINVNCYVSSWSIVVKRNNKFQAYSGQVDRFGKKFLPKPDESDISDSTLFFSLNQNTFNWAFDSLSTKAINMKPIKGGITFAGVWRELSVFNSEGEETFFSKDDPIRFAGPDSASFNTNYFRLQYLMFWLSAPGVKTYIPESTIYPCEP